MQRLSGFTSAAPDGGGSGRAIGTMMQLDGKPVVGLLELTMEEPSQAFLDLVRGRTPSVRRPEEAKIPQIKGIYSEKDRTGLVYECNERPTDLHAAILAIPKPSGEERRQLASIVATHVRSLHVHFQLCHPALRTGSIAFFGAPGGRPDLRRPFILDWGRRPAAPSAAATAIDWFRHPGDRTPVDRDHTEAPGWWNQAWALLMILSEIADWKPLVPGPPCDAAAQRQAKQQRVRLICDPQWKSSLTATVFKYGFSFLDKDCAVLQGYGHWKVKDFYDRLCEMLEPPAATRLE